MTTTNIVDKVKPYKQGSPEWHEARSKGIGGSEIAAIMGLNPWRTPFQVWMEKTGRSKGVEATEKMKIGSQIEDFIASQFTRITGMKTRRSNKFKVSDICPFIGGSVDRLCFDGDRGWGILEMKNVSAESFKNTFADGVPDYYFLQCQTYMLVFNAEFANLFVFVGGERFENFRIERNGRVIEKIIESATDFWVNYVQADIPPQISNRDDLAMKYKPEDANPNLKTGNSEIALKCENLAEIKANIKRLTETKDKLELEIMDFIGENEGLEWSGKTYATWKFGTRTALDTKKLKAEQPEIAKQYETTTETRTFLLKVK